MSKNMMKSREQNFVSAVIYVRDNANKIGPFLDAVSGVLTNKFDNCEIICVNDGSTDGTISEIREFAEKEKGGAILSVLNMGVTQGLELSMDAGVDLTIGDFVFEFDSTQLDFELSLIMDVYYKSLEGFDIVSACPNKHVRTSSRMFYHIYNRHSESPYPLQTESFRVLSRRGINRVYALSKTVPYRKAVYSNGGLKIAHITYTPQNFAHINTAKVHKERRQLAVDSLILFTNLGYRISLFMAAIMIVLAVGVGVYTISVFLGQNKPVEGWTTTMLFLSIAFSGVFVLSGIIIKYLSLLIDLIFKKQKYTIESIEKLSN